LVTVQPRRNDRRKRARVSSTSPPMLTVFYNNPSGRSKPIEAKLIDVHAIGCGVELSVALETGARVVVEGDLRFSGKGTRMEALGRVAWCRMKDLRLFRAGIDFFEPLQPSDALPVTAARKPADDPYEALLLSRHADAEAVRSMMDFLTRRFHPETGNEPDACRWFRARQAFAQLSDPKRKEAIDRAIQERLERLNGAGSDASAAYEQNKRRSILAALYSRKMANPEIDGLERAELEELLCVSEGELNFALWYLRNAAQVEVAAEGRLSITVAGVDRLEADGKAHPVTARPIIAGKVNVA